MLTRIRPVLLVLVSLSVSTTAAASLYLKTEPTPVQWALQIGDELPSIEVVNGDLQSTLRWKDAAKGTLLFVTSSACGICTATMGELGRMASGFPEGLRVMTLAVAGDAPQSGHGRIAEASRKVLKLEALPQLIFVSPEGRVLGTWAGPFGGEVAGDIASSVR